MIKQVKSHSLVSLLLCLILLACGSLDAQDRMSNLNLPEKSLTQMNPELISRAARLKVGYVRLPFRTQVAEVHYVVRNGLAVMEDDILLGTAEEVEQQSRMNKPRFIELLNKKTIPNQQRIPNRRNNNVNLQNTDVLFSSVTNNANLLWPKGVVYYEIKDGDFPAETIYEINAAINVYNSQTNITFKRRDKEKNYLLFIKTKEDVGGSSYVGMQGGKQKLFLNEDTDKVTTGTVIHEIMHALGFYHEHSRANRDDFVKIKWKFIEEEKKHNFYKHTEDGFSFNTYDFESIMHYHGKAFSKNETSPTIVYRGTNDPVPGRGNTFSALDIESLNALYPFPKSDESGNNATTMSKYGMPPLSDLRTITTCITQLETITGPNEMAPCNKKMDFIGKITQGEGVEQIFQFRDSNSKSFSKVEGNNIRPNWNLNTPLSPNKRYFRISLLIEDKDDAVCGGGDDTVDIHPKKDASTLQLWVDTYTGEVWRLKIVNFTQFEMDKYLGKIGETLTSKGGTAADHSAKMTFRVDID